MRKTVSLTHSASICLWFAQCISSCILFSFEFQSVILMRIFFSIFLSHLIIWCIRVLVIVHQSCIHRNSKYPTTSIYLWFDKFPHKFNDTTFKQLVYKLINVEINSSASFHAHLIIIYHMHTQVIGRRVQIVNYKIKNDDNRKIVTKAQAAHQYYRRFLWQHEWKRKRERRMSKVRA